jgi:hypothetical protein
LNRRIKLIWDFRGPDALETAKHHVVHLREFTSMQRLPYHAADAEELSENYAVAFFIIDEKNLITFRDALKPHRAVLF